MFRENAHCFSFWKTHLSAYSRQSQESCDAICNMPVGKTLTTLSRFDK